MNLQPTLSGDLIRIRPLAHTEFKTLYNVASDPQVWELHPQKNRYEESVFQKYFDGSLDSNGAVVIEDLNQNIIGASRFYDHDKELNQVIIGYTFLAKKYWGGRYNYELKHLMINYAFQFVDRVIFQIGSQNLRSRRAIEKIGAKLHSEKNLDGVGHVIYEIRKHDWVKS